MDEKRSSKEKNVRDSCRGEGCRNPNIGGGRGRGERRGGGRSTVSERTRIAGISAYMPPDQTVSMISGRNRNFDLAKGRAKNARLRKEQEVYDSLYPMRHEQNNGEATVTDELLTGDGHPAGAKTATRPQEPPPQPPVTTFDNGSESKETAEAAIDTAAGDDNEESMESEECTRKRSRPKEEYEDETEKETTKKIILELSKEDVKKHGIGEVKQVLTGEDDLEATRAREDLERRLLEKKKEEERNASVLKTITCTDEDFTPVARMPFVHRRSTAARNKNRVSPLEEAKNLRDRRRIKREDREDAEKRQHVLTEAAKAAQEERRKKEAACTEQEEKRKKEAAAAKEEERKKKEAVATEEEERRKKEAAAAEEKEERRRKLVEEEKCQQIDRETVEQLKRQAEEQQLRIEQEMVEREHLEETIKKLNLLISEREKEVKAQQDAEQCKQNIQINKLQERYADQLMRLEKDNMSKVRMQEEIILNLKNDLMATAQNVDTVKLEKERIIEEQQELKSKLSSKDSELSTLKSKLSELESENGVANNTISLCTPMEVEPASHIVNKVDNMLQRAERQIILAHENFAGNMSDTYSALADSGKTVVQKQIEMEKGIQEITDIARSTKCDVKTVVESIELSHTKNRIGLEESVNALTAALERQLRNIQDDLASKFFQDVNRLSNAIRSIKDMDAFKGDPEYNNAVFSRIVYAMTYREKIKEFLADKGYDVSADMTTVSRFIIEGMGFHLPREDNIDSSLITFFSKLDSLIAVTADVIERINKKISLERVIEAKMHSIVASAFSLHSLPSALERAPLTQMDQYQIIEFKNILETMKKESEDKISLIMKNFEDILREMEAKTQSINVSDVHSQSLPSALEMTPVTQPQIDLEKITNDFKCMLEVMKSDIEEKISLIRNDFQDREVTLITAQEEEREGDEKRDRDCVNNMFIKISEEFEENFRQVMTEINEKFEINLTILPLMDAFRKYEIDLDREFLELSKKLNINSMKLVRKKCGERVLCSQASNILANIHDLVSEKELMLTKKKSDAVNRVTDLKHVHSQPPSSSAPTAVTFTLPMDTETPNAPSEEDNERERLRYQLRNSISNALSMDPFFTSGVDIGDINTNRSIDVTLVGANKSESVKVNIKNDDLKKTGGQLENVMPDISTDKKKIYETLQQQHEQRLLSSIIPFFRREVNNSLTPKMYNELITTKVFPYSNKNETLLYHPENLRNWNDSTVYLSTDSSQEEKTGFVVDFASMLEYSMFNNNSSSNGGADSSNISSRLIYTIFEHDVVVCRHLSNVLSSFREFVTSEIITLANKGNVEKLMEATVTSVFSGAMPLILPFAGRIASSLIKPVSDDIRLRISYALLTLIERFLECASRRAHTLRGAMNASGLTHKLSLFPAKADLERVSSFDVRYNYSLLHSLLQMVLFNVSHIIETGIKQIKIVVMSLAAVTLTDNRTLVPVKEGITKLCDVNSKLPDRAKIMAALYYTSHIIGSKGKDSYDLTSLNVVQSIIKTAFNGKTAPVCVNSFLSMDLSTDVDSATLKKLVDTVIDEFSENAPASQFSVNEGEDAILVNDATVTGKFGQSVVNAVISFSKPMGDAMLFWPDVQFKGGISGVNLWALSGEGISSTPANFRYDDYHLSFPRDTSHYFKPSPKDDSDSTHPIARTINNSMTLGFRSRGDLGRDARKAIAGLTLYVPINGVSFVIEEANKERYINLIDNLVIKPMMASGLMPVKGSMRETPRSYLSLSENGSKWVNNPNRAVAHFPVSKWKLPSVMLLYSMLSEKDRVNKEKLNQAKLLQKISESNDRHSAGIAEFMGGSAGSSFLSVLDRETEYASIGKAEMEPGERKNGRSIWTMDKDGMTTLDPMNMVMAGRGSTVKRGVSSASGTASESQTVPYDRGVIALEIERTSMTHTPPEWWSYGIRPNKREEATSIVSFLKHKFFVLTPIF